MHLHLQTLGLIALCSYPALAQQRLWQTAGEARRTQFFRMCLVIGDLDGDGHEDMVQDIKRFTFIPPGFLQYSWEVGVLSGSDGRILRVLDLGGPTEGWRTHGLAAVGDWDGDGIRDYALARDHWTARQRLDIRSGRDDKLLLQLQSELWGTNWGIGLLGDIDLDGDRRPDLVLTDYGFAEPRGPTLGRFIAFANDGRRLYEVRGDQNNLRYWHSSNRCLGRIGDLDCDGCDDYGIGVIDVMGGQVARAAGVAVHSGKTGRRLYVAMSAAYPRDAIGHVVVGCGDWDADGVPDFVASSLVGPAVAFSGANGQVIRSWSGAEVNGSAMAAGDLDRDGMQDIILTGFEPSGNTVGKVDAFSGRDGRKLFGLANTGTCQRE